MSRANEDLIREMYDVFNSEGFAATTAYYADDIVWHSDPSFPEGGKFEGREAVAAYMQNLVDNWQRVELRVDGVMAKGDRVLAALTMRNFGREGVELEAFWGHLWTIRDGRMVEVRSFLNREAALAAIQTDP